MTQLTAEQRLEAYIYAWLETKCREDEGFTISLIVALIFLGLSIGVMFLMKEINEIWLTYKTN